MIDLQHYWVYDIETYPNVFTACFINAQTNEMRQYEISNQRNDRDVLLGFMNWLRDTNCISVGFNNVGFDYPVSHTLYRGGDWYQKVQDIIGGEDRFGHTIWDNEQIVPQLDLYKIHHFDNQAKRTSLKDLEIYMRSKTVQDLPFPPGTHLTPDQIVELHKYNEKDVRETLTFFNASLDKINFRAELTAQHGRNFTNHNDTKIGAEYFIMELEKAGIECYYRDATNKRSPRQTWRSNIPVAPIILPYVKFERPEFQAVLDTFRGATITNTRAGFGDLSATVNGFTFDYGSGGIHGSVESQIIRSDDDFALIDIDVKSYYPNLSIKNRIYPEHLSEAFCDIYETMYQQRAASPKGSSINAMLKLALNGTYGNSNNEYSPFYDPKYTMTITINGQLLLSMLAEQLFKIPRLQMVQANTDGLTVLCPRSYTNHLMDVCKWWESVTQLELEYVRYSIMAIRDVNNYLAVGTDGKVKRKGAYEYDIEYHQDPSALIVKKAVEQYIVNGVDVAVTIAQCADPYDFMIRAKVQRNCQLFFGDRQTQRITRYFVALRGEECYKITPAKGKVGSWKPARGVTDEQYQAWVENGTRDGEVDSYGVNHNPQIHTKNKSKWEDSKGRFVAGWQAVECADVADFDWNNLNYAYYINEALKLVENLK